MSRDLSRRVCGFLLIATAVLLSAGTAEGAPAIAVVVEFYNARFDHYFRTSNPVEVAALESDPAPDWVRTGKDFVVGWSVWTPSPRGVCRFFAAAHTSHFYTVDPQECAHVQATWPHVWTYEGVAFEVLVPEQGVCNRPATQPVYRLFNNRFDVNHRYVTNYEDYGAMQAQGWLPEGVVMCAFDSSSQQLVVIRQLGLLLGSWRFDGADVTFSSIGTNTSLYFVTGEYISESEKRMPISVTVGADGRFKAYAFTLDLNEYWDLTYQETHDIDFALAGDSDRVTGTDSFSIYSWSTGFRRGNDEFTGTRLGP